MSKRFPVVPSFWALGAGGLVTSGIVSVVGLQKLDASCSSLWLSRV